MESLDKSEFSIPQVEPIFGERRSASRRKWVSWHMQASPFILIFSRRASIFACTKVFWDVAAERDQVQARVLSVRISQLRLFSVCYRAAKLSRLWCFWQTNTEKNSSPKGLHQKVEWSEYFWRSVSASIFLIKMLKQTSTRGNLIWAAVATIYGALSSTLERFFAGARSLGDTLRNF